MFGVDPKKIKAALQQFTQDVAPMPVSPDPVVQAIVKFIQGLAKAFD